VANGRPRKTQEELDKEMEDYWNKQGESNGTANGNGDVGGFVNSEAAATAPAPIDEDVDMIE